MTNRASRSNDRAFVNSILPRPIRRHHLARPSELSSNKLALYFYRRHRMI